MLSNSLAPAVAGSGSGVEQLESKRFDSRRATPDGTGSRPAESRAQPGELGAGTENEVCTATAKANTKLTRRVASRAHRPVSTSAGGRPADGKGDLSDPAGSIVLGRLRTSESVRCRSERRESERRESVRKVRHSDHPPLELGHALVEFDAALLE